MPYINREDRQVLDPNPPSVAEYPGDLNFQITLLVDDYIGTAPDYAAINEAIGVLECAKLELYRRIAAPYEDRKRFHNGDVYSKKVNL